MYKHIALIALLLPFSGSAITKQERKQEIIQEVQQLNASMNYLSELIKHNAWILLLSGESITKKIEEYEARMSVLTKEYNQVELELFQESTCIKS